MARRTLLLGFVLASQFAVGCYYNRPLLHRPLIARCPGCSPSFQAPSSGPVMAGPAMADSGYGGGCSSCGSSGGSYPIAGAPAHAQGIAYPAGYPSFSTVPSTMMSPPTIVKSGEAPMPMPPMGNLK